MIDGGLTIVGFIDDVIDRRALFFQRHGVMNVAVDDHVVLSRGHQLGHKRVRLPRECDLLVLRDLP